MHTSTIVTQGLNHKLLLQQSRWFQRLGLTRSRIWTIETISSSLITECVCCLLSKKCVCWKMTDQTLNFEPLPKMGMWFKTHDCEDGIFFFCLSLEREDDGD